LYEDFGESPLCKYQYINNLQADFLAYIIYITYITYK